jgi:polysaccharide deacetylase 2 family uncharacterized protein YibQ
MAPPRAKGRSRKASGLQLPFWILLLIAAALVGAVMLRRLAPGFMMPGPRPPVPPPAPTAKAKPKHPSLHPSSYPPQPKGPETPPANGAAHLPAPLGGPPAICIVIDDVGYRLDLVEKAAAELPKSVTFAIIPFLPESVTSAEYLHAHGFPVILHAPMEPENANHWRGTAGMLLCGMKPPEVDRILAMDLTGVPHAEGINNHMGSLATSDPDLMLAVMKYLKGRGLYFLDSRTSAQTVAYDIARAQGVKTAYRSVFLDDRDDEDAIMKQLDSLVARSKREGVMVAIGHLRPKTIKVLAERLPYYREQGVTMLPLREVVR